VCQFESLAGNYVEPERPIANLNENSTKQSLAKTCAYSIPEADAKRVVTVDEPIDLEPVPGLSDVKRYNLTLWGL